MLLDFTQVSACLPEGEYVAVIADISEKGSRSSMSSGYEFQFVIESPEEQQGRTLFDTIWTTSKTGQVNQVGMVQLKRMMAAAGLDVTKPVDLQDAITAKVKLSVKIESREGFEDQNRIGKVLPA